MPAKARYRKDRAAWFVFFTEGSRRWARRVGDGGPAGELAQAMADSYNAERAERASSAAGLFRGGPAPIDRLATAWWEAVRPSRPASSRLMLEAVVFKRLIPHFQGLEARQLDADRIRTFVVDQIESRGHARETVESSCSWLRRILNWGVEKGYLETNPVPRLMQVARKTAAARARPKRLPPAWTHEEVVHLLDIATTRGEDVRDPLLFASQTGCRRGEFIALEWSEVNFSTRIVTILQSESRGQVKSAKSDKVRHVELSDTALEMLQRRAWEKFRGEPFENVRQPGRVFLCGNTPWNEDRWTARWRTVRRLAHAKHGVRAFRFHGFRHTWATWALAAGEDPAWCAAQIGDTLETFMRRYAHAMPGRRRSLDFLDVSGHGPDPARPPRSGEQPTGGA